MAKTSKFRKKPVVIEAIQLTTDINDPAYTEGHNPWDILKWIEDNGGKAKAFSGNVIIETLEGNMSANHGWYVIRGVKGEFYPCDPEIFAATYEEVIDDNG